MAMFKRMELGVICTFQARRPGVVWSRGMSVLTFEGDIEVIERAFNMCQRQGEDGTVKHLSNKRSRDFLCIVLECGGRSGIAQRSSSVPSA
jgi:hypothetical protein